MLLRCGLRPCWRTRLLLALLSAALQMELSQGRPRVVSPPGAPVVTSVNAPDPFKVRVCAKAGPARASSGCDVVSVTLAPPKLNGGAAIDKYRVVCMPQHCGAATRRPRKMLATAEVVPPCTAQVQTFGMGTRLPSGQLRYKLRLPTLIGYASYKCNATARNRAGWGRSSPAKLVLLPPSPPRTVPSVVGITTRSDGTVVLTVKKPPANSGVTGYLVIGKPPPGVRTASGGSAELNKAAKYSGGETVQLLFKKGEYAPSALYRLDVHHTRTSAGSAQPLVSLPSVINFKTPNPDVPGPPGTPVVTFLDPLNGAPGCADGSQRQALGCGDLTVTFAPPAVAGASEVTNYLVVCKPKPSSCQRPSSGRRRRGLLGMLDPCVSPPSIQGPGEPTGDGRLRFKLPLSKLRPLSSVECNCTAANKAGWGVPSAQSDAFTVPLSPPALPPSISSRTYDPATGQVKVCVVFIMEGSLPGSSSPGSSDYNGFVVTASTDGGEKFEFKGNLGGGGFAPTCVTGSVGKRPNTLFRLTAQATKTYSGVALLFKSGLSSTRELWTPPDAPTVAAVDFVVSGAAVTQANVQLAPQDNTASLTYSVTIGGLKDGPSTVEVGATGVTDGPGGSKVLAVPAAFEASKQYTFQVVAKNTGASSPPSSPAFPAMAPGPI